jgi:chromosome segregation ATPase
MDARKISETVLAAAVGAILPIVGAVYVLGGRMAELDRLREQVAELRSELRASQGEIAAVRADSQKLQEEIRAEVRASLGEALQDLNRQISAAPVLALPSGNSVLTDQARTKQELEQIQQWGEQQQRWMDELGKQISDAIDGITSLGQPGAGPAAPASGEASATDVDR